jgi:hypothetical protein
MLHLLCLLFFAKSHVPRLGSTHYCAKIAVFPKKMAKNQKNSPNLFYFSILFSNALFGQHNAPF